MKFRKWIALGMIITVLLGIVPLSAEEIKQEEPFFKVVDFQISDPVSMNVNSWEEEEEKFTVTILEEYDLEEKGYMEDLTIGGSEEIQTLAGEADIVLTNLVAGQTKYSEPFPAAIYLPFQFEVQNHGAAAANNVEVTVYINGSQASNPTVVGSVSAGKGIRIGMDFPGFSAGNHTISLVANESQRIPESNYSNNTVTRMFRWIDRIELIAEDISEENGRYRFPVGENVTFQFTIANAGTLDAYSVPVEFTANGVVVQFENNGQIVNDLRIQKLEARKTVISDLTLQFTKPLEVELGFMLDKGHLIDDLDRDNNSVYKGFTVITKEEEVRSLNIPSVQQHRSTWCWAAVDYMAGKYKNPASQMMQYDLVKYIHGSVYEGEDESNVKEGASIIEATKALNYMLEGKHKVGNEARIWTQSNFTEAIENDFPVAISIYKKTGTSAADYQSHMVLVKGYFDNGNTLYINDTNDCTHHFVKYNDIVNGTWEKYKGYQYQGGTMYFLQ